MEKQAPVYRYYLADLRTGAFVMEVPFSSVSWQRKVSSAGSFSGTISADPLQDNYDLYDSTMPGKYALYVVRNGVCVWGGMIWGREYNITNRVLKVDGLELSSYFYHRTFWKTLSLSDGISIKTMLETIIDNALNDEKFVDDSIAYSASDLHNEILRYQHPKDTYTVTVTTTEDHGYTSGDTIYIGGFDGTKISGGKDSYNGEKAVRVADDYYTDAGLVQPGLNSFSFDVTDAGDGTADTPLGVNKGISSTAVPIAPYTTILKNQNNVQNAAQVNISYEINEDLSSFLISSSATSGDISPFTFRGSQGLYVGEIIENFAAKGVGCYASGDPNQSLLNKRFDFYIESTFNEDSRTFSNVFKAWLVRKDNNDPTSSTEVAVPLNTLYGPSGVPASDIVFEHPGSVVSLTLNENGSNAATRTWMIDNGNDIGAGDAANYYASYTNLSYLENNWPLLDKIVSDRDVYAQNNQEVFGYAYATGYRLAPPIGTYSVTVNGSFDPEIGSYKPGDWCVIVPGDSFISSRLRPPYENRENILVRKIGSVDVSVPDNPTFPEVVKLDLLAEWEVSKDNQITVLASEETELIDMTISGQTSSPFPSLYTDGIDPLTPITFSVKLRRKGSTQLLATATNARDNAKTEFDLVVAAGFDNTTAEYIAADLAYQQALAEYNRVTSNVLLSSRTVTFQRQDSSGSWIDLFGGSVLTNSAGVANFTYIQNSSAIPEEEREPQNRLSITNEDPFPRTKFRAVFNGEAAYMYSEIPDDKVVSLYIRSKYTFTYTPKYKNTFLSANSFTKIATTPKTAAQVASTFTMPVLTDRIVSSAVAASNVVTITTTTPHLFKQNDPVTLYNINTRVISSAVVASKVATITTSNAHRYAVGDVITLYNVYGDSAETPYLILSTPTTSSFTVSYDAEDQTLILGATPRVYSRYKSYTVTGVPTEKTFTIAQTATNGSLTLGPSPITRMAGYPSVQAAIKPKITGATLGIAGWQKEVARVKAAVWSKGGTLLANSGNKDIASKTAGESYINAEPFTITHKTAYPTVAFGGEYLFGFQRNYNSKYSAQWALDTTAYPGGDPNGKLDPDTFYDNLNTSNDVATFKKNKTFTNTSLIFTINYEFLA